MRYCLILNEWFVKTSSNLPLPSSQMILCIMMSTILEDEDLYIVAMNNSHSSHEAMLYYISVS